MVNRIILSNINIINSFLSYRYFSVMKCSTFRVSTGSSQTATPKPVIFIDAGIHCREWIAPPVALYIIQQLVENSTNAAMYQNVDWYILPNLNPDGYEFTQKNVRI